MASVGTGPVGWVTDTGGRSTYNEMGMECVDRLMVCQC